MNKCLVSFQLQNMEGGSNKYTGRERNDRDNNNYGGYNPMGKDARSRSKNQYYGEFHRFLCYENICLALCIVFSKLILERNMVPYHGISLV